jgi:thioesterase-3
VRIRVRGLHIDYFGHVNNCQYFEYLEEARWARFHDAFTKMMEMGYFWPIVNINCDFKQQAYLGEYVRVTAELERIGRSSTTLRQQVIRESDGGIICDATVTCVVVDRKTERPAPIKGALLELVEEGLRTSAGAKAPTP